MARDRTAAADGHAPGGGSGQIFSRDTQAIFYNWKPAAQRMLDADYVFGEREEGEGGREGGGEAACGVMAGWGCRERTRARRAAAPITAAPPKSWLHRCSVCGDRRARRPRTRREWQRWAPLDRASVASFVLPARAGSRPRAVSPPAQRGVALQGQRVRDTGGRGRWKRQGEAVFLRCALDRNALRAPLAR